MIVQISKETAQRIKPGKVYLVYNPENNSYRVVKASKKDISHYYSDAELEYYYWRKK